MGHSRRYRTIATGYDKLTRLRVDEAVQIVKKSATAKCDETVEVEITDSVTGTRLAAAVDERAGTKAYRAGLKEWSHVKRAYEYWAERIRERLAELRQGGASGKSA